MNDAQIWTLIGGLMVAFFTLIAFIIGLFPRVVRGELLGATGEISGMKQEIAELRGELVGVKGEIKALRGEIAGVVHRIDGLDRDVAALTREVMGPKAP